MPITRAYAQAAEPGNFFVAGKNKIINGDFGIWQRGTSISLTNGNQVYCADRFLISSSFSAGTSSFSQQTFTPGTAPVAGYEGQYFGRLTCGSTASNFSLYQKIEDVRTFAGQTITVSFWIKSSSTAQIQVYLNQNFGSGGSANVDYYAGGQILSSTWTRVTKTVSLSSISGKTIGTNSNLLVGFYYDSGTINSATVDVWGFQVEAGAVATPFTTATGTLAGELAACQRYYYLVVTNDSRGLIGGGQYNGATTVDALIPFPTTMRTEPTLVSTSGTNYYIFRANATDDAFDSVLIMGEVTTNNGGVYTTSGVSGTSGHGGNLYTGNTAASVAFSAEL